MKKVTLQKFIFSSPHGSQYPREFIIRRGAVKISENENDIHIAVVEGSDREVYEFLEGFHSPKKISFSPVSRAEFASFIGESTETEVFQDTIEYDSQVSFTLDSITQDAPVINIINALCIEAIRLEASDIHIEAQAEFIQVRYRIDGILRIIKRLDKKLFPVISNRIKIMADMNTLEQRLPQDGRMTVSTGSQTIDFRVSIIPITNGESIVLRIFNKSNKLLLLDQLGFYDNDLNSMKKAVRQPHGLMVLTGPTGSGKTTTLHALIDILPVDRLNIITLEDPIEQIIPGVNQVQINEAINLSFDTMLRRVLRQDPNVIMVGEIRDNVTAELALRSALTGHLILSTLHTNDSVSVIARLANMGLEPYLIAAVLRCTVAQRLVRKICPYCRKETPVNDRLKRLLDTYHIESVGNEKMFISEGCESCDYSGYKGRTVLSEVFTVDQAIEEMITKNRPATEIREYAKNNGMKEIPEDALRKVADGITSLDEIEREVIL
jgi:general secretion pathway protein E/type IV pilus assembly protein PilB